jgi:hypothetical protein
MQDMNRFLVFSVAVVIAAGAVTVNAQTREARGTVSAVTDSTMTVKSGTQEWTFFVDGETRLEVRRAARDVQQAQPGNPKPRVNAFFEPGNAVLVRYREEAGRNHAINIERVGSPGSGREPSGLAEGKVTSVSASHMSIAGDGRDFTFAITGETDVIARGATKATKAAGKGTPLTAFVHPGDTVSVTYRDDTGRLMASEIRVRIVNRN